MSNWISCRVRLPPYRQEVLTYSGAVHIGYRHHTDEDGEWWRLNNRMDKEWKDITHWMPLPEKP